MPEVCIPVVRRARLMTLLATTGMSISVRLLRMRPLETLLVSSIGASAVTDTDSEMAPTSSRRSISRRDPTGRTMPPRIDFLKPGASAAIS